MRFETRSDDTKKKFSQIKKNKSSNERSKTQHFTMLNEMVTRVSYYIQTNEEKKLIDTT